MNILLAHTHIQQHCGISTYIRTLAHSLPEQGHTVHVVALDTHMARTFLGEGAPLIGLPMDQYAKSPKNFWQSLMRLRRLIRDEEIDVVLASHRWPSFIAYFATRFTGSRLVSVDQNVLWGNKWLTLWGDGVISVSKNSQRHLNDYFGVPKEKIRLIYNAIAPVPVQAPDDQRRLLDELHLSKESHAPILLAVGRLEEQKGHCYLIDAMPSIIKELPQVQLLLVGAGDLEDTLKKQVADLGITAHVHFTGLRQDIPQFLSIADLFVMPSLWEGLPFALLEAMSAGLPAVTTDVGGIPEIVELADDQLGIVVPSRDSDAFAQAVIALWNDPALRHASSTAGQRVVSTHFSDTEMVTQTATYLQEFV